MFGKICTNKKHISYECVDSPLVFSRIVYYLARIVCQVYLSSKVRTKWWTCTDCDDFDLCISCHQSSKHNEHSDQLHQFTAPDGLCIVGNSQIFCDSCGYVFHAQQFKFYDCLKCDNFTLCRLCHKKGMHRKHCRTMELNPKAQFLTES